MLVRTTFCYSLNAPIIIFSTTLSMHLNHTLFDVVLLIFNTKGMTLYSGNYIFVWFTQSLLCNLIHKKENLCATATNPNYGHMLLWCIRFEKYLFWLQAWKVHRINNNRYNILLDSWVMLKCTTTKKLHASQVIEIGAKFELCLKVN